MAATSSALSRPVPHVLARLEHDEDVGLLGAHRVLGDLGAAGLADHGLDLGELPAGASPGSSATFTEPSSEALGSRTTLMAIEPSSSGGMNSVPMSGTSASDADQHGARDRRASRPGRRTALAEQPQVAAVEAADEAELLLGRLLASTSSESTGTTVSATTSETSSAMSMVAASGANILPSIPCSVNSGTRMMAMMSTEKATGRATSTSASATMRRLALAVGRCARWRRTFSTTTIDASTTMPTENARPPRLIRFERQARPTP